MSSRQLQEKFNLIAKYLFTYFERTNFQANTARNVVDTLSIAGHHNERQFSIDFYYNSIRISTDFKRNGNQATLKMENTQINLNQKLGFDLVKDVRLENGELKFNNQNNFDKSLNDLITHINMLINAFTAAQAGNRNPSQVQPHVQHTTTNPYHHTMDPSNSMLPHFGPQVSHGLSFLHHSISIDKKVISHSGIKITSDDTIPGMTSAPLAPLGDTIPPIPSASHEQGVAGSSNSYRHLFPNYPPLQSTSDDRNKMQMKCIKGEYERTYRQPTTSYSPKSSSSSSTTTSKMASSSTGGSGGVGSHNLFSSGMSSSTTKHTYKSSQSSAKLMNRVQQYPYRIPSPINLQTNAPNSTVDSSLSQINLPFDQRPNQRQTNDDAFQTLLQSMRDVANSQSGQIPSDSSAYVLILNTLTGQPSNNAAFDEESPSNDNNDDGKSPLN